VFALQKEKGGNPKSALLELFLTRAPRSNAAAGNRPVAAAKSSALTVHIPNGPSEDPPDWRATATMRERSFPNEHVAAVS
jgi:hypothetical protein